MFNLFKFLLRREEPCEFTGALLDSRPPEEKKDDVNFTDIVATANPVLWKEKYPLNIRKFPVLNQNQSNSCGANALSKAWGIFLYARYGSYIQLSRFFIYMSRKNAPYAGMALPDMFKIAAGGAPLEAITPCKGQNDNDYDSVDIKPWMRVEGETWKITKPIYITDNDIDTIASVIQTTGKGVILLVWFLSLEWGREIPGIMNNLLGVNDPSSLRHFVTAVDFTTVNGKKYLVIEDSAWFGGINVRLISEEWLKNRVYSVAYPMSFKFDGSQAVPSYDGTTIISAQECLRKEGLFPSNVDYIENIGPVTRSALINFQKKYGLSQSGIIDANVRNQLHKLYP